MAFLFAFLECFKYFIENHSIKILIYCCFFIFFKTICWLCCK